MAISKGGKVNPSWSDEERAILRELYPSGEWQAVNERLPNRSRSAIYCQAHFDGVRCSEDRLTASGKRCGAMGGRPKSATPGHDSL